jgi:hypothetical protein
MAIIIIPLQNHLNYQPFFFLKTVSIHIVDTTINRESQVCCTNDQLCYQNISAMLQSFCWNIIELLYKCQAWKSLGNNNSHTFLFCLLVLSSRRIKKKCDVIKSSSKWKREEKSLIILKTILSQHIFKLHQTYIL